MIYIFLQEIEISPRIGNICNIWKYFCLKKNFAKISELPRIWNVSKNWIWTHKKIFFLINLKKMYISKKLKISLRFTKKNYLFFSVGFPRIWEFPRIWDLQRNVYMLKEFYSWEIEVFFIFLFSKFFSQNNLRKWAYQSATQIPIPT